MKPVSIIILTLDCLDFTKRCLNSLKENTENCELIIVDNGSKQDTIDYLNSLKDLWDVKLIFNKENKGSPYAWNQGIKVAKYDYIAIVDNDTMFSPNWLVYLQQCFQDNLDCGAASPSTCFGGGNRSDREIQRKRFDMTQEDINRYARGLDTGYINCQIYGFCFLTHKKVIDKIGVFDWKRYGIGTYEETDFFWRANQVGFKTYWVTHSYVHHYGHTTFKNENIDANAMQDKNRLIFEKRKANSNLFIKNDV